MRDLGYSAAMRAVLLFLAFSAVLVAADLPTAPVLPPAVVTASLLAEELPRVDTSDWPASPSTVPGTRIWPAAHLTHYPPIIYEDERRHAALAFPLPEAGTIRLGWAGAVPYELAIPLTLVGKQQSALVWLPMQQQRATIELQIPGRRLERLPLRFCTLAGPWPHAGLRGGRPVDAEGVPVIIRMPRWQPESQRRWAWFTSTPERPTGQALVVGDPLTAQGSSCFDGLDAQCVALNETRTPAAALLPVLAGLSAPYPRTLVWSPGNQCLIENTWTREEERLLILCRARFTALGVRPRLVLVLPPLPVAQDLRPMARQRHDFLLRTAAFSGWQVIDSPRYLPAPEQANALAPGLTTTYPCGAAQTTLRALIADQLAR